MPGLQKKNPHTISAQLRDRFCGVPFRLHTSANGGNERQHDHHHHCDDYHHCDIRTYSKANTDRLHTSPLTKKDVYTVPHTHTIRPHRKKKRTTHVVHCCHYTTENHVRCGQRETCESVFKVNGLLRSLCLYFRTICPVFAAARVLGRRGNSGYLYNNLSRFSFVLMPSIGVFDYLAFRYTTTGLERLHRHRCMIV